MEQTLKNDSVIEQREQMKKRKSRDRLRRPAGIKLIFFLLLVTPLIKAAYYAFQAEILNAQIKNFFTVVHPVKIAFLFAPWLVAIGFWGIKKWGLQLLYLYFFSFLLYNSYEVVYKPNLVNTLSIVFLQLFFLAIFYLIREDISSPFFRQGKPVWRKSKRVAIKLPVEVEGNALKTLDVSEGGSMVDWPMCPYAQGEELDYVLEDQDIKLTLRAGVVNIFDGKVALAFRRLNNEDKISIRRLLHRYSA